MDSDTFTVRTGSADVVLDLTDRAQAWCRGRGADLLPADDRWRHRHGTPGHGRSHVMPALVPPYATLPVLDGRLALGTWQSLCLVDLNVDNHEREVRFSFLAG